MFVAGYGTQFWGNWKWMALRKDLLNSCCRQKQPVKEGERRFFLISYFCVFFFRSSTKKFHPGHSPAMNLQCTLKFLKHSLPILLLEFTVRSRFITYYPCVFGKTYVAYATLYANGYVILGRRCRKRASLLGVSHFLRFFSAIIIRVNAK